jgi:hypothetical protein
MEANAGIDTPINVDTPLTQMITDPVTGQTQTVKQAMTGTPQAYSIPGQMPKTPVSGAWAPMRYLQTETVTPAPNALERDIAQVAKDTTQAEFDALAPDIGYGVGKVDPKLAEAAGLVDYSAPDIDAMYTDDRIVPEERGLEPFNYPDPIMDPNLMDIRQQQAQEPATTLGGKINSAFENVKGKGTEAVGELKDSLVALGGKVKEGFENIVDFGGTQIDVGKTLATGALNYIGKNLFGPVGTVLGTALEALPEYEPTFEERTLEEELGVTGDGKFAGDPTTSAFAGLNAVSAFGNPVETAKDRIDMRNETIANKGYKPGDKFYDDTQTMIDEYDRVTNELGDIDEDPLGDQQIAEETYADINREKGLEELGDIYSNIMETRDPGRDEGTGPSLEEIGQEAEYAQREAIQDAARTGQTVNEAKRSVGMPEHLGDYGQGAPVDRAPPGSTATTGRTGHPSGGDAPGQAPSGPTGPTGPTGRDIHGGDRPGQGGNGNGNGKGIVCTAMYQTTGLEDWSKAMKIWYIYQQKYLTIQHQEGYHKLFKPFVRGMYKSKIIKEIGAHVAKHRTQHLKHVMFNSKPSLLGKIYNKILEPICYWVGKYAKK